MSLVEVFLANLQYFAIGFTVFLWACLVGFCSTRCDCSLSIICWVFVAVRCDGMGSEDSIKDYGDLRSVKNELSLLFPSCSIM
jgi:hypothetical protein